MASEIHIDDIGTQFKFTILDSGVAVDLSDATLRQVKFKKPDDSTSTKTASVFGDGSASSGVMYYNSLAGDLDQGGSYKVQAKVTIPSGTFSTDIYTFKVHCNL